VASRPLTVGLALLTQMGETGAQWGLIAAGTLIVVTPVEEVQLPPFVRLSVPVVPLAPPMDRHRSERLTTVAFAIIVNTQVFDSVFALTQGGPRGATTTVVWLIYRKLFAFQDTGLAYALSMALLLVILLLTLVTFRVLGGRRRGAR
jgi:hypothetical protein